MKTITLALSAAAWLTTSAADPGFVTSDPNGGWSEGGYYVHNNMWKSGTVNLLAIIKWVMAKGCLSDKSTLNQICFGVEIVSTDDAEALFQVTTFSIDAKSKAT